MRMTSKDSHVWILGSQLLKIFGKYWEVWPCWKWCMSRCRLLGTPFPMCSLSLICCQRYKLSNIPASMPFLHYHESKPLEMYTIKCFLLHTLTLPYSLSQQWKINYSRHLNVKTRSIRLTWKIWKSIFVISVKVNVSWETPESTSHERSNKIHNT